MIGLLAASGASVLLAAIIGYRIGYDRAKSDLANRMLHIQQEVERRKSSGAIKMHSITVRR